MPLSNEAQYISQISAVQSCSWNIYEGNMAAGVFSSVYGEHRKVQQVPAKFSTGSHLAWATGTLLTVTLLF